MSNPAILLIFALDIHEESKGSREETSAGLNASETSFSTILLLDFSPNRELRKWSRFSSATNWLTYLVGAFASIACSVKLTNSADFAFALKFTKGYSLILRFHFRDDVHKCEHQHCSF